jgi:hypothetical protein
MKTDIFTLAGMNAQLVISANDLKDFAMDIYRKGREDAKRESKPAGAQAYTRAEAAAILHVTTKSIDNMRKDGFFGDRARLGLDKIGARVLIPKHEVDKYLK